MIKLFIIWRFLHFWAYILALKQWNMKHMASIGITDLFRFTHGQFPTDRTLVEMKSRCTSTCSAGLKLRESQTIQLHQFYFCIHHKTTCLLFWPPTIFLSIHTTIFRCWILLFVLYAYHRYILRNGLPIHIIHCCLHTHPAIS